MSPWGKAVLWERDNALVHLLPLRVLSLLILVHEGLGAFPILVRVIWIFTAP